MFVCGDDAGSVCVSGGEADLDAILGAVLGWLGADLAGSLLLGGGSVGVAKAGVPAGGGGNELDFHLCDEFAESRLDRRRAEDASTGGVDGGLLGAGGGEVRGAGGAVAAMLLAVSPAGIFETLREDLFGPSNSLDLRNLRLLWGREFDFFSLFADLVLREEEGFGDRWPVGRFD